MILLFILLALAANAAHAVDLVEVWDCGTEASKLSKIIAEATLRECPITKDNINMCCKDHDYCYETHELTNFTREYCDFRFCACLQDAEDINNDKNCTLQTTAACSIVKKIGGVIFPFAHPKNFTAKFAAFVDTRPLGMEMARLVGACVNAKGMAVHCHNTVTRCIEREGKKEEGALLAHSHEDCRSMMYECLQIIADTNDTAPCPAMAKTMSGSLNIFAALSADKHGKSAIEIYPIISARLLQKCQSKEPIESCLKTFDDCSIDPSNRESRQEFFNSARRVKLTCHTALKECIVEATKEETQGVCVEARELAMSRIRETHLEERSAIKEAASRAWKSIKEFFSKKNPSTN